MKKALTVNLGPVDDIPVGHGQCFIVKGEEIAVFRPRSGGVFAMEDRCPHRQGSLADGIIGDGKVICPLHGRKFDLVTGESSTAPECVTVFNAWVEDGDILIECPRLLTIDGRLQSSGTA